LNFDVPNNFLTKKFQENNEGYVLLIFGQDCFGGGGGKYNFQRYFRWYFV
jgi:hypothetical protein